MKYRPEIDGLRAVAVIAVLVFHAFPQILVGGFAGVDVFFVISGFLITSIVVRDINAGEFSYFSFLVRRINRLLPSLLTVLLATVSMGYYLLFANEFKEHGKHVAASAMFMSNFLLISEVGYFDTASSSKPLLHLWSLAVEEQFYFVWPLVILVAFVLRKRWGLLIGLFALVSFSFNLYLGKYDPEIVYYQPFARFGKFPVALC